MNIGSRRRRSIRPRKGKWKRSRIPKIHEEADLYRSLGLDYIPPELRENCGEFEAAAKGRLPRLIEEENLRGTFHCHTTASDGRSSLEAMASAAEELGLQYLGIADHSRSSIQAHGLDEIRLRAQMADIRRLNAGRKDFRIFAGVECDILRDGTLEVPDEILAELDYVVASVHSAFTLTEAEMTERIIRAISNSLRDLPRASNRTPAVETGTLTRWTFRRLSKPPRKLEPGSSSTPRRSVWTSTGAGGRSRGEGREMRDQSGCARGRSIAGALVRDRHRAKRMANESRCGELSPAGADRSRARAKARKYPVAAQQGIPGILIAVR